MKKYTTIYSMGPIHGNNPKTVLTSFNDAMAEKAKEGYIPAGDLKLSISDNAVALAILMVRDVPDTPREQ